jgi:hypothetical protein
MQFKTVYFTWPSVQCLYYNICMHVVYTVKYELHTAATVVIGSDVSVSAGRTPFGSYLSYMRTLQLIYYTHALSLVRGCRFRAYLVITTYYYAWIAIIVLSTRRRLYDLCLPYVPDLAVSRDRVYLSTWYVPDRPSWKWICTKHVELYITRVPEKRRFYRQKTTV